VFTDPTEHHHWLKRMLGDWTFTHTCDTPDGPTHSSGTERVESFGDLWIIATGQGDIADAGLVRMRLALGYDPMKDKYIGTWIGSPMAQMFIYEGSRTDDTLTLDTEGPSMDDPINIARYQDVYEIIDDNTRTIRSRTLGDDGNWIEFMRGEYTRVNT